MVIADDNVYASIPAGMKALARKNPTPAADAEVRRALKRIDDELWALIDYVDEEEDAMDRE